MAEHEPVVPRATYRVQMHAGFGFDAVADVAAYLAELGVSHVYCSPYLQAAKGSTHGYDVLDHRRANEELGGSAGHARMCEALGRHGLGQVVDIVPNHMSIAGGQNAWWWDVLENGPSSRFASHFDVDWRPIEEKLHNTVLLPVLGDHYGRVLEAGEIHLKRSRGTFTFHYHDHTFPVAPRSLNTLLAAAAERAESDELAFIADGFGRLPHSTLTDRKSILRRHRDKEVLRVQLERLTQRQPEIAKAIDGLVAEINASPDELDVILERQNYRLAFWRTAGQELDYRRFFDINTLVSLRTEDDKVFADTHVMVLQWLREGILDGLRIDHPDGLRDPDLYFQRLRQAAPRTWLVAEKILEPHEKLPEQWPVAGTTGYDFINRLQWLYIDPASETPLTDFYAQFTGEPTDFKALARDKKHLVLRELFGSDVHRITTLMVDVCERRRRWRDYTRRELNAMLREVMACFPVYRTYVRAETGQISEADIGYINEAVDAAKANRPDLDGDLFEFLRDVLLLKLRSEQENELVMRFQQTTGPVMAKGVEDTAFYNFNRLVTLNEVGGDPGRFGISLDEFHHNCAATQGRWGASMLASTTHDTKRSEDVRARLALLSEIPQRWADAVRSWSEMNEQHRRDGLPDRNAEYLLYQTLVGAWPIETPRVLAYMEKASREAKAHTSWTKRNDAYDAALRGFIEGIMGADRFLRALHEFVAPLIEPGRINSLSQTAIRLTAPGVPDVYQGTELWTLTLVDPDNRRSVDYAQRRSLLAELATMPVEHIRRRSDEGLPKMWVIRQTLALRKRRPELFAADAAYQPLVASGSKAQHVVAFSRGGGAMVVAPRLVIGLAGDWVDTTLVIPDGAWQNELTGERLSGGDIRLAELLKAFPVALLCQQEQSPPAVSL